MTRGARGGEETAGRVGAGAAASAEGRDGTASRVQSGADAGVVATSVANQVPAATAEAAGEVGSDESDGSSEEADESDAGSVVVESEHDEPETTSLAERLAEARRRARMRAGRLTEIERRVMTIESYSLYRTLRRARRKTVETVHRFPLQAVANPQEEGSVVEKKERLFAPAPDLLQEPALPTTIPAPEPEASGTNGEQPRSLPKASQWWQEERERQQAHPFRAGQVAEAEWSWKEGMRILPPPSYHMRWGPVMRLADLEPETRRTVLKLLAKDFRSGAIEVVDWEDVDLITPIFIAFHPVTLKPRLVHDLRALNVRLRDSTVSMDRAMDALCHGSFAAKLDLLQAFRHVRIRERDRRVVAFEVDGIPIRWNALPFGASQSPELFAKAVASAVGHTAGPGWRVIVYVDDILVVASSEEILDEAMLRLMQRLRGAGWYVALDKAFPYAMTVVPFLGVLVDLTHDCLRVSLAKARRLHDLCTVIIGRRRVSLRDLQRVGGLLAFMSQAAPEAALAREGINAATAEAERLPGRSVGVKGRLRDNLVFWQATALHLPQMTRPRPSTGSRRLAVATDAAGLPRLAFGGIVWTSSAPAVPDIDAALREAASRGPAARDGIDAFGGWAVSRPFPGAMASESSSALEVGGLHGTLAAWRQAKGVEALRGCVIDWYCDSQVAVGAVGPWRARAPGLVHHLTRLLEFARKYEITIRPHWVARTAGWQPITDALSKVRWQPDTAEWRLPEDVARQVMQWATFAPEVDLFSTESLRLIPRFVSQWPETGAWWCDAFARPWSGLRLYAFPPFSVAQAMLRHMCASPGARMVAVVPRTTPVPARLQVAWRRPLSSPHLVDVEGHQAPGPCPTLLDAVELATPG